MYLSKAERQEIMASYGYENSTEINHYEVRPDTWIYLFEYKGKKYILVATDYFGDYDFDVFPHLLKFESDRLEFVLQREIPVKDGPSREKASGTLLFEYTD
ncbi:hypothetical protein IIY68_01005 [Candidatus Saccharibacteria bacterium]|nr:hypothetical protein [Candidatus Saccharibacteria bacterium]